MFLDALEIPGEARKVATFHRNGGNFGPEWVATFKRNGGNFAPDYAQQKDKGGWIVLSWADTIHPAGELRTCTLGET